MSDRERTTWDRRWRARTDQPPSTHAAILDRWADALPASGRALDVAGGAGRNAIWFARRGLDVCVADISPAGLALAETHAARVGVCLETIEVDFDSDPVPAGPWDLVWIHHYKNLPLLDRLAAQLGAGGVLAVVHQTVRNLERHERPSARWLVDEGEIAEHLERAGLTLEVHESSWGAEGRHETRIIARRVD